MLQLPILELLIFLLVMLVCLVSSVLALVQLVCVNDKYRTFIISLVAGAAGLEFLILVLRGVSIQSMPLTGLFESMIILSVALGLTFLFFCAGIRHIWFSSVMVWFITGLVILSAFAASPVSEIQQLAKTPWAAIHGLSMIFSGTAIAFSGSVAVLFLLTRRNLKQKKIGRIIGKMPNIQKLESLNVIGIKTAFVLLTLGVVSGVGLAAASSAEISLSFHDWITDSKVILILSAWVLLAVILILRLLILRVRAVAVMTLIACFLIIFSIIGTSLFCDTAHDFALDYSNTPKAGGRQ